jgi:hypothetical protein
MFRSSRNVEAARKVSEVCLGSCQHNSGIFERYQALCNFICLHSSISSIECLQAELLDIGLASSIISDGIIIGVLGFSLSYSAKLQSGSLAYMYLFQFIHQQCRVLMAFCVAIMKSSRQKLVDYPVFTYARCQTSGKMKYI